METMLTFFKAELTTSDYGSGEYTVLEVKAIINRKPVSYTIRVGARDLHIEGLLDRLIDEFKRKIKEALNEKSGKSVFEEAEKALMDRINVK